MDGVLAALAPTPAAVVADMRRSAVREALDEALEGRIAIISGRTISEIDRISGIVGLSASGIHGLERRRRDGSVDHTDASPRVARAVDAFRKFAGSHPGTLVEDKGGSASLHYRQAPAAARAAMADAEVQLLDIARLSHTAANIAGSGHIIRLARFKRAEQLFG
jgi:trehalose 6-phosphate phosphatase